MSGDDSVKSAIFELESVLNVLFIKEREEIKIRSREKWLEEGDTPCRFFFKLARKKFDKRCFFNL